MFNQEIRQEIRCCPDTVNLRFLTAGTFPCKYHQILSVQGLLIADIQIQTILCTLFGSLRRKSGDRSIPAFQFSHAPFSSAYERFPGY